MTSYPSMAAARPGDAPAMPLLSRHRTSKGFHRYRERARAQLVSLAWASVMVLGGKAWGGADVAASTEWPLRSGWELGFRTGVILPGGDLVPGSKLSVGVGVQFPLVIDVGYRINELVSVGAVGQIAFGTLGSGSCGSTDSCLDWNGRVGAEVQLHPLGRAGRLDPWLGVGFGYEWQTYGDSSETLTVGGFDFLNLDIGIDFPVGKVHLGPFFGFTLGQFSQASDSGKSNSIDDKALHYWFCLGLKLTVFP
jgi:hypothetical protein